MISGAEGRATEPLNVRSIEALMKATWLANVYPCNPEAEEAGKGRIDE